jgi:glycosyltransferase involved in cell wall biosynthesis
MVKRKFIRIIVLDISQSGGIEQFAIRLKTIFEKMHLDTEIVSVFFSGEVDRNLDGVIVLNNFPAPKNKFVQSFRIFKLLMLRPSSKVIHTYNNIFIIHFFLNIWRVKTFIYTEHSSFDAVRRPVRVALNFLLPFVGAIVAQTESSFQKYVNLNLRYLFKVAPAWINTSAGSVRFVSQNNCLDIAFVGRLEREKGILEFLDLIRLFTQTGIDIRVHIFGTGSLSSTVAEFCNEFKGYVDVFYYGYVEDWFKLPISVDYLFILSRSESFSIAGLEALARGAGVVYFDDLVGPAEFCNEQNSIAVSRNMICSNIDELAKLMLDRKHGIDFRLDCMKSVEIYSIDHIISVWRKILNV